MPDNDLPDDAELGVACDALKDRGLNEHAALYARLVGAARARRAPSRGVAGEALRQFDLLRRGGDGRFYRLTSDGPYAIVGTAARDLEPGEGAPFSPLTGWLG